MDKLLFIAGVALISIGLLTKEKKPNTVQSPKPKAKSVPIESDSDEINSDSGSGDVDSGDVV